MKKIANKTRLFFYILLSAFNNKTACRHQKFLIIDTLRLGDVVMSTPVFRAIKEKYPDSYISVLVRSSIKELLTGNRYIDEVIPYYGSEESSIGLIKKLSKGNYSTSINLCEGKFNSLIFASNIPRRVGYIQKHKYRDRFYLTDPVQWSGEFTGITEMFMKLLEPIDIQEAHSKLELYAKEEDIHFISDLLPSDPATKIVIHPGSRKLTKRWPHYKELITALLNNINALIILTGDITEAPLVNEIAACFDNRILNLAGKTTLTQLTALYSLVNIVIGNDTGALHIARAVKTPSITIFGPEDPKLAGYDEGRNIRLSENVPCKPDSALFGIKINGVNRCIKADCDSHLCMKKIMPDYVAEKVLGLLASVTDRQ